MGFFHYLLCSSPQTWLSFLTGLVGEKLRGKREERWGRLTCSSWDGSAFFFLETFLGSSTVSPVDLWKHVCGVDDILQPSAPFLTSPPPRRDPLNRFSVSVLSLPGASSPQETGRLQPHTLSSVTHTLPRKFWFMLTPTKSESAVQSQYIHLVPQTDHQLFILSSTFPE